MNNVVNLIESKRIKAKENLNPIFKDVWEEVVKLMNESSKLYPTVTISWTTRDSSKVNVKCGQEIVKLSIEPIDVSIEDTISYVNDLASTRELEKFSVETRHPTNTHYGKEEKLLEEGIDVKVTLKTLF